MMTYHEFMGEPKTEEPSFMSREVAERLGMVQPVRASGKVPAGHDFTQLQHGREQRDEAAWNALWEALDPKLRTKAHETARDLAEAEQALTSARAQIADLDNRQPSKPADVPKWAARRGEVVSMISAYETLVHGARQAYERAAQTALVAAQEIVTRQWQQAGVAHKAAEAEYRRRRDEAQKYLAEQNEVRDTVRRLHERVSEGDLDMFR